MKKIGLVIMIMAGFFVFGIHNNVYSSEKITNSGNVIKISGDSSIGQSSLCFIDSKNGWAVDSSDKDEKIIKTTDGGASWDIVYKTPANQSLTIQKIFYINQTTGWMIEQTTNNNSQDNKGTNNFTILKTVDGGKSFTPQTKKTLKNQSSNLPDFSLTFFDNNNGYALIYGTLFKTTDGGKNWSKINLNLNIKGFLLEHIDFVNKDTGWICGTAQTSGTHDVLYVFRTVDGGKSFRQQLKKDYKDGSVSFTVGINFIDKNNGWFLTCNYCTMMGDLFKTTDGGKSFHVVSQLRCSRPSPVMVCFSGKETGWIPTVPGAGPVNGGIMRTIDGGKSFKYVTDDNTLEGVTEVIFPSKIIGYAISISSQSDHMGYIMKTMDGGNTWAQIYPKFSPIKDISFVNTKDGFGVGLPSDPSAILSTDNGGKTWIKKYSLLRDCQYILSVSFINNKTGYVLALSKNSYQPFLFKTSDGGNTWVKTKADLSSWQYYQLDNFKMFDGQNGEITWLSGADGLVILKTVDGGNTWFKSQTIKIDAGHTYFTPNVSWLFDFSYKNSSLTISRLANKTSVAKIASIPATAFYGGQLISNDSAIIAIQQGVYPNSVNKLLFTCDEGATWTSYNLDIYINNNLIFDFIDGMNGWIETGYGLLRTADGGKTWTWE